MYGFVAHSKWDWSSIHIGVLFLESNTKNGFIYGSKNGFMIGGPQKIGLFIVHRKWIYVWSPTENGLIFGGLTLNTRLLAPDRCFALEC